MEPDRIAQLYNLIKQSKSDATINDAIFAHDYIYKNPIITKAEEDIRPMTDFIKLRPELVWFIDEHRVSVLGYPHGQIVRQKYPDLILDDFLAMMMVIWKELLTDFVVAHGYNN